MVEINGLSYSTRGESNARLIEIPKDGQTPLAESQASINARSYNLSTRNAANAYIIPTEDEKLYLNFIGQKIYVTDQALNEVLQPKFEYFTEIVIPEIEGFTLPDGIIVRSTSLTSIPKNKEDYDYYIMMDGELKKIPNYKTLEVMLAERNQNLLSVRILEEKQFNELPMEGSGAAVGGGIPNKQSAWKDEFSDITSLEALKELEDNAKAAGTIANEAKASAQGQINAVQSQAAAQKAAMEAAQAQSQAAQTASESAIAEAEAAQAEAEAAQAEAQAAALALQLAQAALNNGNL